MKKILFFAFSVCLMPIVSNQIICGYSPSSFDGSFADTDGKYIANGKVFTPKDTLRALVVFVSYGEPYDSQYVPGWPEDSEFPLWIQRSPFYKDISEFSNNIFSDTNRFSVSNFYYQMSNGTFKLMADYYPHRVVVNVESRDQWRDIHRKALQQISDSINWSLYDNRTNLPNYHYDNSISQPDNIIDYVIFCHRFSKDWPQKPSNRLSNVDANGISTTDVYVLYNIGNGYFLNICGFTFITGGNDIFGTFVHELGHELYDGPHYAGGNGVVGEYFYEPNAGWGMMRLSQNRSCALGWERYILDWVPQISAMGQSSDIKSNSDLSNNDGIFILRDFITTGDAIRIQVPSDNGRYQYLWLENHQCKSTFDGNLNRGYYCNTPIEEYKRGLVAYVETYSHVKEFHIDTLVKHVNGIRWLSRNGDYDFGFEEEPIYPDALCYNKTYPFYRRKSNNIGGQSVGEAIRQDFNNDGYIQYNEGMVTYNIASNENEPVVQLDNDESTAKYFTGTGMQFQVGDKVGIARNPCVRNIPTYNKNTLKMGDYFLNGISFEILRQNLDGSMIVKVRLDDVAIDKDVRWAAGSIVLTNITKDSRPDVNILSSVTVDIDKSGTPNRHKNPANPNQTSSTIDDFITPTTFTCREGSYFKQEGGSTVNVINSSTLVIEDGATYELGDRAVLNIEQTGSLIVRNGATLHVKEAGHVEIKNGAYVCIENGANIVLDDTLSMVNLRPGYINGLNTALNGNLECGCTLLPSEISVNGHGQLNDNFSGTRCIQDTIYTESAHESGEKLNAGYDVCEPPLGNVKITNGAKVIFDGEKGVFLKNGIEVELGSSLEIR